MKQKKIPMRTCVITKEQCPKTELFRIVRTPEGTVVVDNEKGRANGRGAYLKKDIETILKAQKSKALERHLEIKIEDQVYEDLKMLIQ